MVDAEHSTGVERVERVQLGVRMEKRLVKVLKGLAEFEGLTLGQLLEKIVLHSFAAVPGEEGELAASPHSKRALAAVTTDALAGTTGRDTTICGSGAGLSALAANSVVGSLGMINCWPGATCARIDK